MGCMMSTSRVSHETPEDVNVIIKRMLIESNAYHCKNMRLMSYVSMGMQDAQYSPNMTTKGRMHLDELLSICRKNPELGNKTVRSYLEYDTWESMALAAENNMIYQLTNNPKLFEWFKNYTPENYMFDDHPNMAKLSKLVYLDGHSGASFALCCRSVHRRINRNSSF